MSSLRWVKLLFLVIILLVLGGLSVQEWWRSQIVGHLNHRFNLALIVPESSIAFVSFDPTEKSILVLPFPSNLSIRSRTSGEYSLTSLYRLGSYAGQGGMFARQKIQGFMRIPIPGYIVINDKKRVKSKDQLLAGLWSSLLSIKRPDSSLSRFDAAFLLWSVSRFSWKEMSEEGLVRAAVIESIDNKLVYHPERLQEFVGDRFVDWGMGSARVSVAVLNASGENGLGSDMADFLKNVGFDVVMVRSIEGNEWVDHSSWAVADKATAATLKDLFHSLFNLADPLIGVKSEYRSQVVITVGKDAKELF